MSKKNIRLFKPSLDNEEINAVKKVFSKSWLGLGEEVNKFEKEFCKFINSKYAIGVNSGTAALDLAVKSFDFNKNKNILVNNLSFVSSASCIVNNGLEPILIDCEEDNLGFDINDAKKKINKNTVAIVIVHYGGVPANLKKIIPFAKKNNLKIIEDCAHCLGVKYLNKKLGTFGDVGCFSFEEKKGITTGDGGMVVTNNHKLFSNIKRNRWLGIDKETWIRKNDYTNLKSNNNKHWFYKIDSLGYKYNMNDLAAAIGRVQLKKIKKFINKKQIIANKYYKFLSQCKHVKLSFEYSNQFGAYWLMCIRVKERDKFIKFLKRKMIPTGVHYIPISNLDYYKKYKSSTPKTDRIWKELVSLPYHSELKIKDVEYICKMIIAFYK